MRSSILNLILPALAGLSLGTAGILHFTLPQDRLLSELAARSVRLDEQASVMRAAPRPSPDEGSDLLPRRLSFGELISVIETKARASGLESISLASGGDEADRSPGSAAGAATTTHVGPTGSTPSASEGASSGAGAAQPKAFACRIQARGGFEQFVHFLGQIELAAPLMRVRALEITPAEEGIEASVALEAYWYPGKAKTEASPATPGR